MSIYEDRYKLKMRKLKLCIVCGKKLSIYSIQYCKTHNLLRRLYSAMYAEKTAYKAVKKYRVENKKNGNCIKCSKSRRGSNSINLCKVCLNKRREYNKKLYNSKKPITKWFI